MKIKLAICALVLTALMTVPAFAASVTSGIHWSNAVVEEAVYGTPTIDGVISPGEWDDAKLITITLDDPIVNQYGVYQGNWDGDRDPADFSTEIRFMWDDTALYIYEKRVDDEVVFIGSSDSPWSEGDGNLVFLQVADKPFRSLVIVRDNILDGTAKGSFDGSFISFFCGNEIGDYPADTRFFFFPFHDPPDTVPVSFIAFGQVLQGFKPCPEDMEILLGAGNPGGEIPSRFFQ